MENLFDVIGNRMFSVFASKDRRANYELLLFIYDTFTKKITAENYVLLKDIFRMDYLCRIKRSGDY